MSLRSLPSSFDGRRAPRLARIAVAIVTAATAGPLALAGPTAPANGPRAARPADAAVPPAKPALDADLSAVEDELARYLQFRGDVGPDGAARLELLVDLRLLARWLLASAAAAPAGGDLQVTSFHRAREMSAAAVTLEEHFKTSPKPTDAQLVAMGKVHALTFALPELKQVRAADDVCRQVGGLLAAAAGPLPPELKQLPVMRPAPRPPEADGPASATRSAQEVDPVSRAQILTVSPGLKRQLVALATAAAAARRDLAHPDAAKRGEAAELADVARRALDIAEGFEWNTGVDARSRPRMEQQLADGAALLSDPRTRPIGRRRVADLDAYAQTLARIRGLGVGPDVQKRLAPAFRWAGNHPDARPTVMATVEAYLAACRRADARAAGPRPELAAREAKAVAEAMKTAVAEREAFLVDVAGMNRPSGAFDLAGLGTRVEQMRRALDAADTYERVPRALQAVLAFRPRPTGALERRVAGAMVLLADARPAALGRDDAARAAADLVRLADLAADPDVPAAVPPDVARAYARNKLAAFEAKRHDLIAELASGLAAGRELDAARAKRLGDMRALRVALAEAAAFEAAVGRSEVLNRWADWPVTAADLRAAVAPYREAMAAAFEAHAADATPPADWPAASDRHAPVLRFVIGLATHADACVTLPAGWPGHAARLATPMDGQPFARERRAAFHLYLVARFREADDDKSAELAIRAVERFSN